MRVDSASTWRLEDFAFTSASSPPLSLRRVWLHTCGPRAGELANEARAGFRSIQLSSRLSFATGAGVTYFIMADRYYDSLVGKDAKGVFPLRFESTVEMVGGPAKGSMPGLMVLEDFQTRRTRTVI